MPFEVPEGWCWCVVNDFAYVAAGSTPSKDSFVEKGIPYIKMYNLRNQKIDFSFHPQYIKEDVHNGKLKRSRTEVGDLIMNIVGPPLGKLAFIPPSLPESNFNQAAVLIRPLLHKDIINRWLFYYLSEMSEINSISTKGSAGQVNISLTQSQNMRVPMPPLAEQVRICSEIEKLWQDLDCIDTSSVVLGDTIECVKSKILDLAIHGKLVPQDPTDEPASELLKRINPEAITSCDNPHYGSLPQSWSWTNLGLLFDIESAKRVTKDQWKARGVPFYRTREIVQLSLNGYVDNDLFIDEEHYSSLKKKYGIPMPNDIMLTAVGTIGKTYVVSENDRFYYKDASVLCLKNSHNINPQYITLAFSSSLVQNQLFEKSKGTTVDTITIEKANNYIVPIPPIEEQSRIVSKVKELFSLLDMVKESLQA